MRETLLAAAALLFLAAWTPFPTAVGPEIPLDAPAAMPTRTVLPTLATDGRGALLLAIEPGVSRIGFPSEFYWVGALDENAAPRSESQFLAGLSGATAASSGRGYLVTFLQDGRARAIRYSATGARLDATPILLSASASAIGEVTWDGTAYVVVANDEAISIGEDGRILGTRDVPSLASGIESAARNGVTVLVNHGSDTSAVGPMYAHAVGIATHNLGSGTSADVAAGDPGFLVVFVRGGGSIHGQLLDPSGAPDGEAFAIAPGEKPAVAWNGTEWVVVYESNLSLRAVRVNRGPLAPSFEIDAAGANPAVAAKDGKVFVAWDHLLPVRSEVRSATLEGEVLTANAGAAAVVSTSQTQPMMATVDGATLLAWFDGGGTRIRRMDGRSAMRTINGIGHPVAFAAGAHDALLVTRGPGAIVFTRVDRNGATLSTQKHTWNATITYAGAAWIGDRWVVVWQDNSVAISTGLARTIVQADGTPDTPRRFGSPVRTGTIGLGVVAVDAKALVLWSVNGNGGGHTKTFTIDRNGTMRTGRDLGQRMFTAASRGAGDALAARVLGDDLEWERVLPDGTVAAEGSVTLPAQGMTLQTFFTGENYLLLLAKTESAPDRLDLYGLRVDVSGAAIDPEPVLFASAFTTFPPTFAGASLRDATTLDLAYFRALDEAGLFHQFPRLVFRSVHDSPRRRVVR